MFASCGGGTAVAPTPAPVAITIPPDVPHARTPPVEEDAGAPTVDAGPRCVPAIGRACPPVRGAPSIVLDPDLTPTDGGFPAISRNGDTIAVARIDADGRRGAPNLTILLFRASDGHELRRLQILDADEAVRIEEEGEAALAETVRARVRAAEAALRDYESLDGIDFVSHDHGPISLDSRGLHLAFDAAGVVTVADDTGERGRTTLAATTWPDGAWTDPARHVLVLRVAPAMTEVIIVTR